MTEAEMSSPEELEKFYEEMFSYRYTDEDPDYIMTIAQPIPTCPCVTGYYTRSRNQDNRNQDRRGGWRGRGQGHWQGRGGYHGNNRGEGQGYGNYRDNYRDGGRGGYHGSHNEGQGHHRRSYDQDRQGGCNRHSRDRYRPY